MTTPPRTPQDSAYDALSTVNRTRDPPFALVIANPPATWRSFIAYIDNHQSEFDISGALFVDGSLVILFPNGAFLRTIPGIPARIVGFWETADVDLVYGMVFTVLRQLATGYFVNDQEGWWIWAVRWCPGVGEGVNIVRGVRRMSRRRYREEGVRWLDGRV